MKYRKNIDTDMIMLMFNEGKTQKQIAKHFSVGKQTIQTRFKHLGIKAKKTHSIETKMRLSELRKKYLAENPDKHPWRSHNKFKSVPCENLKTWLREKNIQFEEEFPPLLSVGKNYSIDIAFPDKLVGVEVNGNQHYNNDGTLKPYYEKRRIEIENAGWKLYQVHYSMCYNAPKLLDLIPTILNSDVKVPFDYQLYIKPKKVKAPKLSRPAKIQKIKIIRINPIRIKPPRPSDINPNWRHTPKPHKRNVVRPNKEELTKLVWELPTTELSKKLGVSDVAIGKWCKFYDIKKPARGYWAKLRAE